MAHLRLRLWLWTFDGKTQRVGEKGHEILWGETEKLIFVITFLRVKPLLISISGVQQHSYSDRFRAGICCKFVLQIVPVKATVKHDITLNIKNSRWGTGIGEFREVHTKIVIFKSPRSQNRPITGGDIPEGKHKKIDEGVGEHDFIVARVVLYEQIR